MNIQKYPTVLTIAGSDSGGGAGIQADIKTISALGCFAASAITALTVQNTLGVSAIHKIPPAIVGQQIQAVLSDMKTEAIKIGMLNSTELVITVAESLLDWPEIPVVLDPVMIASSGDKLMQDGTLKALIDHLLPLTTLLTPNLAEAEVLAQMPIRDVAEMTKAGQKIIKLGCKALLLKGGHLKGGTLTNLYFEPDGSITAYNSKKIITINTHGTGCTLSSAIASFIARGQTMKNSVDQAQLYVNSAIEKGKDVLTGKGTGPLNHFFAPHPLLKLDV